MSTLLYDCKEGRGSKIPQILYTWFVHTRGDQLKEDLLSPTLEFFFPTLKMQSLYRT